MILQRKCMQQFHCLTYCFFIECSDMWEHSAPPRTPCGEWQLITTLRGQTAAQTEGGPLMLRAPQQFHVTSPPSHWRNVAGMPHLAVRGTGKWSRCARQQTLCRRERTMTRGTNGRGCHTSHVRAVSLEGQGWMCIVSHALVWFLRRSQTLKAQAMGNFCAASVWEWPQVTAALVGSQWLLLAKGPNPAREAISC